MGTIDVVESLSPGGMVPAPGAPHEDARGGAVGAR